MCKSIHFLIYITNPYVFVSLLATTGAASRAHMRRVSFEFLKIRCCFCVMRKFATVKQRVWRSEAKNNTLLKTVLFYTRKPKTIHFWIYIRKPQVLFFTIGDDGSRQYPSESPHFDYVQDCFWIFVIFWPKKSLKLRDSRDLFFLFKDFVEGGLDKHRFRSWQHRFLTFSYVIFFRASGEAILGTLKYFS